MWSYFIFDIKKYFEIFDEILLNNERLIEKVTSSSNTWS